MNTTHNKQFNLTSYEINTISSVSSIVFISDLHFDFVNGKFYSEQSTKLKDTFISYVKTNYPHSLLCIAGDCFSDWCKTLSFIKDLENEKINGFIVLGNHDYWNDKTKSYEELLHIFTEATKDHSHFRLLVTGRKYYLDNLCFIGDTGWTSFIQNGIQSELSQFMNLPDASCIKDFSPSKILSMHNSWIKYANEILGQEKQVIVITHFPMINFGKEPIDNWWSSETQIKECKNCWKIFGHTHKKHQRKKNNISAQRGYKNINFDTLEELIKLGYPHLAHQYTADDFGLLVHTNNISNSLSLNFSPLFEFYSPNIVKNPDTQIELIKEIKSRGFKRSSRNWEILAELANNPYEYLKHIKTLLKDYEKSAYIGYRYTFNLSEKTIHAIHTSIDTLEFIFDNNDFSNPTLFIMSAIITGYVYNYMPEEIDNMRPVDFYDIVRFYLVFQTMKKYNLGFNDINSIRKHKSRAIQLANVPVGLPSLNKQCMTLEEAELCLKSTSLLTNIDRIE